MQHAMMQARQMALTQDLILSQPDVPAVRDVIAYLATPSKRCVLLLSIWDTGMLGFVDAVPSEVYLVRLRNGYRFGSLEFLRRIRCSIARGLLAVCFIAKGLPKPRKERLHP